MRWTPVACALACALMIAAPAAAQLTGHTVTENGVGPLAPIAFGDAQGRPVPIDVLHGLPTSDSCTVVSGNQAYAIGSANPLNCTPTGRLKVGLGSSTNVDHAAQPTTTIDSVLIGCKYRSTAATWLDQETGSASCDASGNLKVTATPIANPSNIVTAQLKLTANTAAQLSAIALTNGIVCKTSPNNAADVLVGGSGVATTEDGTGTGYILAPGEAMSLGSSTAAAPWFISTAAAVLSCIGN